MLLYTLLHLAGIRAVDPQYEILGRVLERATDADGASRSDERG